ncbi:hypothetical protein N431DRAFT_444008 [Stipitochalara longipes BDJ]|nr:hypothetical protein N431DRAFT_444008 [Stipitochalara longipes BDJ]
MAFKTIAEKAQHHEYTTIVRPSFGAQPKTTNYGLLFSDYEDFLDFLERVKCDPELVSQIVDLLISEWRPAITTALDLFYERLQCSNCNSIPGAPKFHRRLCPDGQRALESLAMEMKRFPVENLSSGKLMQFITRLRNLEKECLDANLGEECKGFA